MSAEEVCSKVVAPLPPATAQATGTSVGTTLERPGVVPDLSFDFRSRLARRSKRFAWKAASIICFGIYVCELLKSVGLLFVFLSTFGNKSAPGLFQDAFVLLANCLAAGISGFLGKWAFDTADKIKVKEYDAAAVFVFKLVRSGAVPNFWIYLRPFYITGRMTERFVQYTWTAGSASIPREYELERQLVKITKGSPPIVALGKPGEAIGVGRILTGEDEWREAAASLMQRAAVILCIPSSRPGTKWELDQIIERGYLKKTVFLMPFKPVLRFFAPFKSKQLSSDLKNDWEETVKYMREKGVEFPKFRSGGLLFHFGSNREYTTERLDLYFPRATRRGIKRMIAGPALNA